MPVSLVTPSTRPATSSPNALADLVEAGAGVLDRVVQQRGAQRLGVEAHAGADLGDADRVGDEVLARLAALVGVVLAGEHERLHDGVAVDGLGDLVGVLLDDREEVGEELALEVGRDRRERSSGPRDRAGRGAVDRPMGLHARRPSAPSRLGASGCRSLCPACQECQTVLESLLVGPEGRRALERGALRGIR